jgi:hypothetical protein
MMRRMLLMAAAAAGLLAVSTGCKKGPVPVAQIKDMYKITVDEDGFHPDRIPALVGKSITLVITRTAEKTCANAVVIAQENIRRDLPVNTPVVISFIPEKPGDIHFACPMNHYSGEIAVQDVEVVEETKAGGSKKIRMKKAPAVPAVPGGAAPPGGAPAPAPAAPAAAPAPPR